MMSFSSVPSFVEGGAVRSRSSGGSWYGPVGRASTVAASRRRAGETSVGRLLGRQVERSDSAAASGSTTTGSVSPRRSLSFGLGFAAVRPRPTASAFAAARSSFARCFSSFASALARSSARLASARACDGARGHRRASVPSSANDVPVKIRSPDRGEAEVHEERPRRGDDLRRAGTRPRCRRTRRRRRTRRSIRCRGSRIEPGRTGSGCLGRSRAGRARRGPATTKPMNMRTRSSGDAIAQQRDAPAEAHDREQHRGEPEPRVQQPRERLPHRAGGVEPDRQHREPGEHHEPDAERVARERREDLAWSTPAAASSSRAPSSRELRFDGGFFFAAGRPGCTRRRTPRRGSLRRHEAVSLTGSGARCKHACRSRRTALRPPSRPAGSPACAGSTSLK